MLTRPRQRVLWANRRAATRWRYGAKVLGCGGRSVGLPDDVRRFTGGGLIAGSPTIIAKAGLISLILLFFISRGREEGERGAGSQDGPSRSRVSLRTELQPSLGGRG